MVSICGKGGDTIYLILSGIWGGGREVEIMEVLRV